MLPLAHLAHDHPEVARRLHALARRQWSQATPDWLEYWRLLREPPQSFLADASSRQVALIDALRDGPQPVPEILKRLKALHVGQLDAAELHRQEIIGKAGLTPTDLMHVEGSHAPWDSESAALALEVFSHHVPGQGGGRGADPALVCRRAWQRMTEMAAHAIITFLTGKKLDPPGALDPDRDPAFAPWFFHHSLYGGHPHLQPELRLKIPIIGIGAPAGLFLGPVAAALRTDLILPPHHEVANAVGAVAGSVMVSEEVLVYPRLNDVGLEVLGYYVQAGEERADYEDLMPALARATALARDRALGGALRSGADNPQVVVEQQSDGLDMYRIRARAVGNPRLSGGR